MVCLANPADTEAITNVICDSIYACHADHHNDPQQTAKDFYLSQGFMLKNDIIENGEIVAFEMVLPL